MFGKAQKGMTLKLKTARTKVTNAKVKFERDVMAIGSAMTAEQTDTMNEVSSSLKQAEAASIEAKLCFNMWKDDRTAKTTRQEEVRKTLEGLHERNDPELMAQVSATLRGYAFDFQNATV